jgi:hypothetical protein
LNYRGRKGQAVFRFSIHLVQEGRLKALNDVRRTAPLPSPLSYAVAASGVPAFGDMERGRIWGVPNAVEPGYTVYMIFGPS